MDIDYRYDDLGRLSTATWAIEGTQYEIGHTYDPLGRPDTLTYPKTPGTENRLVVRYGYNDAGYLNQVTDTANDTVYWQAEARNAAGQLQRESVNNGTLVTNHEYDVAGLLHHTYIDGPGTGGRLDDLTVGYDANRNVISRNETVSQRQENYTYDTLDRLKTWRLRHGSTIDNTSTFIYDPLGNGNLKSETVTGQPDRDDITYGYGKDGAPPHALTSRNADKLRLRRRRPGDHRSAAHAGVNRCTHR